MPDTDRILEAEQSIQGIATELKRMRDAANLLEGSQAKTDAVLTSAERVVQAIERFSSQCGVIVTRLSSTDLNQRLDDLQTEIEQIATLIKEGTKGTIGAIANLESELRDLDDQLQSIAKGSKARQITTLVFVIITSVVALVILAKILVPSLGG